MYHNKPIIGIAGGIGSGKSLVADLFGEFGCLVIHADQQVRMAYQSDAVRTTLRDWWGDAVFKSDGSVDRKAVASMIFREPEERARLEELLHPIVALDRDQMMEAAAKDPAMVAYIWDTPLLFEVGLDGRCDAVVFVDCPLEMRLSRVEASRGWNREELLRRENLQWPLDKKKKLSQYTVVNAADAGFARSQVKDVLSRIRSSLLPTARH